MKKTTKLPSARRLHQSMTSTTWTIKFPSTPKKEGAFYFATTYPDSDFVYVLTAKRRPVSKVVGRKLIPTIRAAIDAVIAGELQLRQMAVAVVDDDRVALKSIEELAASVSGPGLQVEVCRPPDESGLKALFDAVPPVGDIDDIPPQTLEAIAFSLGFGIDEPDEY